MSLILKGIDMPRTGERVYAEIRPSGEVEYIAVSYDKDYTRSAKVERTNAIQIPKGHGRVIDGGWVKYNLENYSDLPTKYLHMDLVREAIEDAPTILEAGE